MLGNVNANLAKLSQIYNDVGNELSSVMEKIAAGTKYVQPSDDYVSFLQGKQASNLDCQLPECQW